VRPIRTRFRYGSGAELLNLAAQSKSPDHYAKGTPSLCRSPKGPGQLRQLVSAWFQVLFHSPPGVLFTFPSRYWFTIGRQRVFSLGGWSLRIPAGFHVSRGTWELDQGSQTSFAYGPFTLCGTTFRMFQLDDWFLTSRPSCATVKSSPATPVVQRAHA
jgi:hypothetical protein